MTIFSTKHIVKRIALTTTFAFLIFTNASYAQTSPAPEKAAKDFYAWYVRELKNDRFPVADGKQQLLKSVSRRLGKWIYSPAYQEYGADYMIDAQDFDESWQVSTTKAAVKGNAATLKVFLKSTKPKNQGFSQTLQLKLVKENGGWKIDSVNNRTLFAD
jgi:hypothetical protein